VVLSNACNALFDIDAPTLAVAGSSSGATGGVGAGGGSGGAGGVTGGTAGRGGTETAGTGGATGGASGGTTTGGRGGATGGTAGDIGEGGSGDAAATGGAPPGGAGGSGGGAGNAAAGVGGSDAGTSGAAGAAGTGGMPGPCEGAAFRGGELVLISHGTGIIGADDINMNTLPVIMEEFDDFCIDRTEVTVAAYAQCIADGDCEPQGGAVECNRSVATHGDHPVTCVTHDNAVDFCVWANKRLPTEKEWEYAARGPEGRRYPWGEEEPNSGLLNYNSTLNMTTVVGNFLFGATPDTGLVDMAGNVWEWTASEWCEDYSSNPTCVPGSFIARGGSFASNNVLYVRPSWRDPDNAGDHRFGFRCAAGAGSNP
jgi:formylglycine-generating enzyme required for sulfatase activity